MPDTNPQTNVASRFLNTAVVAKRYSVEFFHIYTDEIIGNQHEVGLDYLKSISQSWTFEYDGIILIDDYNPKIHNLTANQILHYLDTQNVLPTYWAFEKDLVTNAQQLLESLTNRKLKNNYMRYVENHNKYPCSLLTAGWYLTRLGRLDTSVITSTNLKNRPNYLPADRLFNLLPKDYRSVEERARQIIKHSPHAETADRIQDLFYPVSSGRAIELF